MVGQVHENNTSLLEFVTSTGPPLLPAGSMVPVICINRLGCVGPSTEQK